MNNNRKTSHTEVTHWKVTKIVNSLNNDTKEEKIEVPKYQRSLVWSIKQQEMLIQSIIAKFPIGALLLYKTIEGNRIIYSLVDGLQRASTLQKYMREPTKFFNEYDIKEDFLNEISTFINNSKISNVDYREIILGWVKSLKGFESEDHNFSSQHLIEAINEELGLKLTTKKIKDLREKIVNKFTKRIRINYDIKEFDIPIIIYSGDENNLPIIFERLNKQGTQLSKYQIYAATWATKVVKIESTKIIEQIRAKYDALINEGLQIENYNINDKTLKDFTAFEYFLGLGKYIRTKYQKQNLFSNRSKDEDTLGFNLSAICLGLPISKMNELPDKFLNLKKESKIKFEDAIYDAIDISYDILKPYIALKSNNKGRLINRIFHTDFQIIAIIAVIFQSKYDIENNLKIIKNDKETEDFLQNSIIYRYLYDIIRGTWRSRGHIKAYYYKDKIRRERVISKDEWNIALNEWYAEQLQHKEIKREKISSKSLIFLNYIYTKTITAHDHLSNKKFEIEHIVPFSRFKKNNSNGLPISCIANLCLIDKDINRKKGDKTIYEFSHNEIKN